MFSMDSAIGYATGFGIAVLIPMLCHYAAKIWPSAYADLSERAPSREEFQKAQKGKNEEFCKHLFYVGSFIGIGSLVIGFFLPVQALSSGFMFGGTFSLIQAIGYNWREIQPGLKFVVLLIAIAMLTIIGYVRLAH